MPVSPSNPPRVSHPAAPGPLTIGAVLAALAPEFPEVSISKIRFLEAEGLLRPERTSSGYRMYSPADLERLRYILTAQRDRFWPLKVIREALDKLERGLQPASQDDPSSRPQVPAGVDDPDVPTAFDLGQKGDLRLTDVELREAAGLNQPAFEALSAYGLLRPDSSGHYGQAALAVARSAGALAAYGIEPRHLRPFRTAADREIGLVQQVVSPMRGRGRGSDGDGGSDPSLQILAHCIALHTALVKAGLAAD
jgi:DNA-binding transcriptional MerR regulator